MTTATKGSKTQLTWASILERTVWSALESLAAIYLTKGTFTMSGAEIALLTGLTAALTAVKTGVLALIEGQKVTQLEWLEDAAARTAFTFGETLLAALITAAVTPLNLASFKAAFIAAGAAALSAVKSALAQHLGTGSAATLPEKFDPESKSPLTPRTDASTDLPTGGGT